MSTNKNLQPTQVIAQIFGVSTRRVEQLKTEGIIKGEGKPTKYDLLPTIQAYIKYLSDKAHGREEKKSNAELEKEKLVNENRLKSAKAEMAELELQELRGEMHRSEDVEAIVTEHVMYLRSMLLALPGKLAVDCAQCKTAAEASAVIQKEVYFVLESLSEFKYNPDEYKKRVRERKGWKEEEGGGNDD